MLLCRLLRVRAVCLRRARLVMLRLLRRRRRRRGGMRMRRGRRRLGRCRRRGLGRFCIRFWCRLGRPLLLLGREGWFEDVVFFSFFRGDLLVFTYERCSSEGCWFSFLVFFFFFLFFLSCARYQRWSKERIYLVCQWLADDTTLSLSLLLRDEVVKDLLQPSQLAWV